MYVHESSNQSCGERRCQAEGNRRHKRPAYTHKEHRFSTSLVRGSTPHEPAKLRTSWHEGMRGAYALHTPSRPRGSSSRECLRTVLRVSRDKLSASTYKAQASRGQRWEVELYHKGQEAVDHPHAHVVRKETEHECTREMCASGSDKDTARSKHV
jgi:hypothetical protein